MKCIGIVYMVAGLSSRFGNKIKAFEKVGPNGEMLIEYSINQALKAGFNKIIFIVGNKTENAFKEKFGNKFKEIEIVYAKQSYDEKERDKPWGTVDALCAGKEIINFPFVVCNGDDIYGENTFKILYNHLNVSNEEASAGYILGGVLPESGSANRGIFSINEDNSIKEIREVYNIKKDRLNEFGLNGNDICSMNIFALHPETIKYLESELMYFKEKNKEDRKVECLLPNILSELIKKEKIKMKLYLTKDNWFGITNHGDETIVGNELRKHSMNIEVR